MSEVIRNVVILQFPSISAMNGENSLEYWAVTIKWGYAPYTHRTSPF